VRWQKRNAWIIENTEEAEKKTNPARLAERAGATKPYFALSYQS
jgi:hypothetical protein